MPGTILVVEDEILLREIVAEWLEFEGYKVFPAQDGEAALRLAEANPIDVIVTDMRMPVLDGLGFLKRLRTSLQRVPPTLLMSGFSGKTLREAYDVGIEVALAKPFTDHQLLSAVQRLLTPRRDRWQMKDSRVPRQNLQATFTRLSSARAQGLLAFGSGGFCLRSTDPFRTGPIQFDLHFTGDNLRFTGQGLVQWIEAEEAQMGVEITGLEAHCIAHVDELTAAAAARGYIPRSVLAIRD